MPSIDGGATHAAAPAGRTVRSTIISGKAVVSYSHIILVTGSRAWENETLVQDAFWRAWTWWGPSTVTRPLLVSGHASGGADRVAEKLWASRGLESKLFPADWASHGRAGGPRRNQEMVDFVASQRRQAHTDVLCLAFVEACRLPDCPRSPAGPHVSHGTGDCLARAARRGITAWRIEASPVQLPVLLR